MTTNEVTLDEDNFRLLHRVEVTGGEKLTGEFTYKDVRGDERVGRGHVYVPTNLSVPVPLLYAAGYEFHTSADHRRAGLGGEDGEDLLRTGVGSVEFLRRGWVVV